MSNIYDGNGMINFKDFYSKNGYPAFTKRISENTKIYIKNRIVLKNREGKSFNLENEINSFNDIAIEENGIVNIYCSKDKIGIYSKVINDLKEIYPNIQNFIFINSK